MTEVVDEWIALKRRGREVYPVWTSSAAHATPSARSTGTGGCSGLTDRDRTGGAARHAPVEDGSGAILERSGSGDRADG